MSSIKTQRSLFATPLVKIQFGDAAKLNAALIEEIAKRRKDEKGIVRSNHQGWHSDADFFQRKEVGHRELAKRIARVTRQSTEEIAAANPKSWSLGFDGWINVNEPGSYNAPHDHPGAFWSGVYYVAIPARSGLIELLDPRPTPAAQALLQTKMFASATQVKPKPGLLILFPSSLKHWVQPNESADDRISIAFNATVQAAR